MICYACTRAGEANARGDERTARDIHASCVGCECQHKTGKGWIDNKKTPHADNV